MGFELQVREAESQLQTQPMSPGFDYPSSMTHRASLYCYSDCTLTFFLQVRTIEERLPRCRQNLMFSATIPPRTEKLASELMEQPLFISVGVVRHCPASLSRWLLLSEPPGRIQSPPSSPALPVTPSDIRSSGWRRKQRRKCSSISSETASCSSTSWSSWRSLALTDATPEGVCNHLGPALSSMQASCHCLCQFKSSHPPPC